MKALYTFIVDHLTKLLGAVGGVFMTVAAIDPSSIRDAASTYLGTQYAAKIGGALFALVILRGWYTGQKAKVAAQALADAQAKLNVSAATGQPAEPAAAAAPPKPAG